MQFGFEYEKILNDLLFENMKLKFEKILTYAALSKKGYSYSIYETFDDIDNTPKLAYSGTSVSKRSTCTFQKNTLKMIDGARRDKLTGGFEFEYIMNYIFNMVIELINSLKNDVKNNMLSIKDFANSKTYRKCKTANVNVLNYNENVKKSLLENEMTIIQEGDRYYYILLTDDNRYPDGTIIWDTSVKTKVTEHEKIITLSNIKIPQGKRIWIEYYINHILNDTYKRFTDSRFLILKQIFSN